MAEKTGTNEIPLPPVPVVKSWNGWITTVIHHSKYIEFYKDFVAEELEIGDATRAQTELQQLLDDRTIITQDVNFTAANAVKLIELLVWFLESSELRIHLAYNQPVLEYIICLFITTKRFVLAKNERSKLSKGRSKKSQSLHGKHKKAVA